jgi:hypothetical protein
MGSDGHKLAWASAVEEALRALRDVDDVRIQSEGETIREVHVVSSSQRPAKQIVRDIQSLIQARFNRSLDHRVVSVAFTRSRPAVTRPQTIAPAAAAPAPAAPAPIPTAPVAPPIALHPLPPAESVEDRVRFGSVNLFIAGPRAQAQVELRWRGETHLGSAAGWSSRDAAFRLVASATLAAVQEIVQDDVGIGLENVEMVRIGRQEVVVVGLVLLAHRQEKLLVGSCPVEQDAQQAVALATLAALNRVIGSLRTREATEYVLKPSSAREASEAKRD